MMTFSDTQFIFRFLPVFLAVFYIAPAEYRRLILLVASLFFYALGDPVFFALLIVATLLNHVIGRDVARHNRSSLALIVTVDVLMLTIFKALGAFVSASLLPVGISFYTFKMISYQVDLYRGPVSPYPSPLDAITYFSMFPQIVSGPIMRYADYAHTSAWNLSALKSTEEHRRTRLSCLEDAAFYFCLGLGCKVLIADHLSYAWQAVGTIGYAHLSTPLAWLGVIIYSLNLYYDFWGYSLMAGAVGVAMGFPFIENFHHPYASGSVGEFYRRWHMTLGQWFRDYLFIPLGGSRVHPLRVMFNYIVVWLATALWHGFSLTFLVWGMSLCALILWEKYVVSHIPLLKDILGRIHVLLLVPLTWIPFALDTWPQVTGYFHRLFPFFNAPANVYAQDYVSILGQQWLYLLFGLLGLIPAVYRFLRANRRHPLVVLILLLIFWLSVYSLSNAGDNPFLYFRF